MKCVHKPEYQAGTSNDLWAPSTLRAMSHNIVPIQFSILVCLNEESGNHSTNTQ